MLPGTFCFTFHLPTPLACILWGFLILFHSMIFYLHKLNETLNVLNVIRQSVFLGTVNIRLVLLIHIVLVLVSNMISPELFLSFAKNLLTGCEGRL